MVRNRRASDESKEVVMTEEWNESDDFKRVGTEGLSGEDMDRNP